ncbi:uncharacterized protein A4U43_C03F7000 [Asparagus officinalis]|uniref:Uncharacterized protein n=1 Tax=Asparagus officinalis TaxID=4686 RepID=A0A5P1FCC1_ASPOF|nr:uncharacterized protein LOC109833133 [Asparagus officinalis]ONK74499.1 uncharacterized protein A4U43_C03F7000 [Asparagus officinalis]
MASLCRSPAIAAVRSAAGRSQTLIPITAPSRRFSLLSSRAIVSALGTVESLIPLHSAIASSRLKSSIGVDSSCWTCLSQGRALPL